LLNGFDTNFSDSHKIIPRENTRHEGE